MVQRPDAARGPEASRMLNCKPPEFRSLNHAGKPQAAGAGAA